MNYATAARKTVRLLSARIDRSAAEHTMLFSRQPDGTGFMDGYYVWQNIRDAGWPETEQRAQLLAMQKFCMDHKIITAEEVAAINTRYGVEP